MRALFLVLALSAWIAPARGTVWIVDAAGGGNFADLPSAVAAAAPGDVLLVRPGRYSGAQITRALHVQGLGQPGEVLTARIAIYGLPAGERVVLRGLSPDGCGPLFLVRWCAGLVQIEQCGVPQLCALFGYLTPPSADPNLWIDGSDRVVLVGCTFTGLRNSSLAPVPAARIDRSRVWMYGCTLLGTFGRPCEGDRGGLALRAELATLSLSGCSISGGAGSMNLQCVFLPPCSLGSGGDAIDAPGSSVFDFGSSILGGYRGSCSSGPQVRDGFAWVRAPSVYVREAEPLPRLDLAAPLVMGTTATFLLELASANPQVVFVAFAGAEWQFPGLAGTLWLDPLVAFPIGTTNASVGTASLSFPVENDPLAYGFELHFQAIDVRGRFGAPTSAVLQ